MPSDPEFDSAIVDPERKRLKALKHEFQELCDRFESHPQKVIPKKAKYPSGIEIVIRKGYYQANEFFVVAADKIWRLFYNGRNGDDWSHNNVAGGYIGSYVEREQVVELVSELMEVANQLGLLEK